MKKEQLVFFSQLQEIQEQIIASKDNFQEDEIKLDLIDKLSGNSIKSNIQLHDQCALFLKSF